MDNKAVNKVTRFLRFVTFFQNFFLGDLIVRSLRWPISCLQSALDLSTARGGVAIQYDAIARPLIGPLNCGHQNK